MPIVGGLDIHRKQITFDYLDTVTGEVRRGQIAPADREHLRAWLARFHGRNDVAFAVEGCTGWRYVCEELAAADVTAHLAEPADTAFARGRKRHAKTDRTDCRHLRTLLAEGRLPECWIPPGHILECRALLETYHDLRAEHTAWVQRIHAVLFHQGAPALGEGALRTEQGRAVLRAARRRPVAGRAAGRSGSPPAARPSPAPAATGTSQDGPACRTRPRNPHHAPTRPAGRGRLPGYFAAIAAAICGSGSGQEAGCTHMTYPILRPGRGETTAAGTDRGPRDSRSREHQPACRELAIHAPLRGAPAGDETGSAVWCG